MKVYQLIILIATICISLYFLMSSIPERGSKICENGYSLIYDGLKYIYVRSEGGAFEKCEPVELKEEL